MRAYRATASCADAIRPLDLIAEAFTAAGLRERRRRLLPAAAAVVFVLGYALFCGEGYGEVARKLAGAAGRRKTPSQPSQRPGSAWTGQYASACLSSTFLVSDLDCPLPLDLSHG